MSAVPTEPIKDPHMPTTSRNQRRVHPISRFSRLQGSGAHGRNGRDPAVDQESAPTTYANRPTKVNPQLRDFQRIGQPLAWIVGSEDGLYRSPCSSPGTRPEHRRVRRAWAQGIHPNPAVHQFGAEDSSEMTTAACRSRNIEVVRPPLPRANGRIDDYRRALSE